MKALRWSLPAVLVLSLILSGCGTTRSEVVTPDNSGQESATTGSGATAAGSSAAAGPTSTEPLVLKFSHVTAPATPKGKAAQAFADRVKERLGDRVVIEVYPNAELFNDGAEMEALRSNEVHFIAPTAGKMPIPEWQIFDIPFLVNTEKLEESLAGQMGELLVKSTEPLGLKVVGVWTAGPRHFTNSQRPLQRPEDFAELKFRIQKSPVLAAAFDLLGAKTQAMPLSKVYEAMKTGQVDGGENTFSNIYTKKMHEVQDYLTVSNHALLVYPVVVNADYWNKLPADIRTELEQIMLEVSKENRTEVLKVEQGFYEKLKETMEVTELTPEDRAALQEAMQPLYNEWEQQVGAELIDAAKGGY